MKTFIILNLLALTGLCFSASTSMKEEVQRRLPLCPDLECNEELLGCAGPLAVDEAGCTLCKCAEEEIPIEETEEGNAREICMEVADAGSCKKMTTRYFYNEKTGDCETFQYGGCGGNENNFETIDDCKDTCGGSEEEPFICPTLSCTAESLECVGELAEDENMCEICECAEPEVIEPDVEELSECEYQRETAKAKQDELLLDGPFVPECEVDGSFSSMQCYWDECWCVLNPHGAEIQGTRVAFGERHTLACDEEPGKKPPPSKESMMRTPPSN